VVSVHFVCLSSDKGGALPHKDSNLSVGSDFVSFLQDVFAREIAATWWTCSSAWRMQRIDLNGEEEPVWLTPYLRIHSLKEGEGDSD